MHGENNLLFGLTNDAFGYILTKEDWGSFKRYEYVSRTCLGEMTGEHYIDEALKFVNECPQTHAAGQGREIKLITSFASFGNEMRKTASKLIPPMNHAYRRKVLECACPLALSTTHDFQSARGLAHSKMLTRPNSVCFGSGLRSQLFANRGITPVLRLLAPLRRGSGTGCECP